MGALIVVSGPSGVGKGTILRQVFKAYSQLEIGLSWTTRQPRPGDDTGTKRYHYVSRDEFMTAAGRNEFLEWAEYSGNLYGSHIGIARYTLREIDVQGAEMIAASNPRAVLIGILPPGESRDEQMTVLEERLCARGSEDEQTMRKRLAAAQGEITAIKEWKNVIINDDADRASAALVDFLKPYMWSH